MAYTEVFTNLGLAKNEAKIYESLLHAGETTVADITRKTKIHRRNVYDSLNRLIEKGLAFEIIQTKENHYKAVDPNKLSEILEEKQDALTGVMPDLQKMYKSKPKKQEVYIYKGIEGYKNYMRDILRLKQDVFTLGAKGAWYDKKLMRFAEQVRSEARKLGIKFTLLYEHNTIENHPDIAKDFGDDYRILPKKYSTGCTMDIFADRIVILSNIKPDGAISDQSAHTVVVNKEVADAFRTWFGLMWSVSKK